MIAAGNFYDNAITESVLIMFNAKLIYWKYYQAQNRQKSVCFIYRNILYKRKIAFSKWLSITYNTIHFQSIQLNLNKK
jgi:hypothetical protein